MNVQKNDDPLSLVANIYGDLMILRLFRLFTFVMTLHLPFSFCIFFIQTHPNSSNFVKTWLNLAHLGSFSFISFFIKKTQFFIKIYLSFCICLSAQLSTQLSPQLSALLSAQLSTRLSAQLSIQLSILVIRPVICPVVRQVICPVICPIILWCLMLPNLTIQVIKLSDGNLQCE